jgi:hypothetical protein
MNSNRVLIAALGCCALSWPTSAAAGLLLSFDNSSYSIVGVNGTVAVPVFISQTPDGPQIAAGNELLTSGIVVSENNPTGIARVLLSTDVSAGPAWDSASSSASATTATLATTSLAGIANLSSPVLLGTFHFTGLALGTTTISVANLTPGPSFITVGGDVVDPGNIATATIEVKAPSLPEPSTQALSCAALAIVGAAEIRRRRVSRSRGMAF